MVLSGFNRQIVAISNSDYYGYRIGADNITYHSTVGQYPIRGFWVRNPHLEKTFKVVDVGRNNHRALFPDRTLGTSFSNDPINHGNYRSCALLPKTWHWSPKSNAKEKVLWIAGLEVEWITDFVSLQRETIILSSGNVCFGALGTTLWSLLPGRVC